MSNHLNRSLVGSPARSPTPDEVRAARDLAGLSQTAAAELLHTTCRTWQQWEAGDRRMHPAFFELFSIKVSRRSGAPGFHQAVKED